MQTLHSYEAPPREPGGRLIAAPEGGFLGTSPYGGRFDLGTVYQVTSDGQLVTLGSFGGTNGSYPQDLIRARDGTLYGATIWDGENGKGGIFKFDRGGITVLAAAPETREPDGVGNPCHLFEGLDGNLYGAWKLGSPTNYTNVIFSVTTNGTLTIFAVLDHSYGDISALAQSSHPSDYGTLYGATANSVGGPILFKISTEGKLSTILSKINFFDQIRFLVTGGDGGVYGVKESLDPVGFTVFRITREPDGNIVLAVIASIAASNLPELSRILTAFEAGSDGAFYGATGVGPSSQEGDFSNQIFRLSTDGTLKRIATAMPGCTPAWDSPECGFGVRNLVLAPNDLLYGTAGPIWGLGSRFVAFQITPSGQRTNLASLNGEFGASFADESSDGSFFGFTQDGGLGGQGSIVRITTSGKETTLASFDYRQTGERPQSLFLAKDGNRYGLTGDGGPTDWGTIFKLTPDGLLTVLFPRPEQTDGFSHPLTNAAPTSLVEGDDGMLYFMAVITNQPNIFQITSQGELTPLTQLAETRFYPMLIGWRNGTLFGVNGTEIFTLRSKSVVTLFAAPGKNPSFSNVLLARDGNLYGTASESDPQGRYSTSFFQLTPSGAFTRLSTSEIFGQLPYRTLFEGTDGNFYGTALFEDSTIAKVFRVSPEGTLSTLTSISLGQPSEGPHLIQGRDGLLYGFLQDSTPNGFPASALLFRLVPTPHTSVRRDPSGEINLSWNSFARGVYGIDYKTSLSEFDWKPLTQYLTAKSELTSLTDNPSAVAQRYYRVRLLAP